jgi:hypothetical protein
MHNVFVSIKNIKQQLKFVNETLIKKGPAASRTPRTKPTVWIKDVLFSDQQTTRIIFNLVLTVHYENSIEI